MLRILIATLILLFIGTDSAWAQGALPVELANEIDRAAMSTLEPNRALETVVVEAVAEQPALVESIVARAVARDPSSAARIVSNTSQWFPGFAGRIRQAAEGPLPQLPPATVGPGPVPSLAAVPATRVQPVTAPQGNQANDMAMAPDRRFYVEMNVGAALSPSSDVTNGTVAGSSGNMKTKTGFVTGGAIGMHLGQGIRTDFEVAYRRNEVDSVDFGAFGLPAAGGSGGTLSSVAFLLNGYFDIPLDPRWTSSFGVGLGGANVSLNVDGSGFDKSDFVFAYQMAGEVAYALTQSLSATAGYKYFATADPLDERQRIHLFDS